MANGNLYDNRRIVEKYLNHKLSKNGHAWEFHRCHASNPDDQEERERERERESARRATLHRALREAGDELESLYRPDLAEMTKRLRATPVGAEQRRFAAVADELFSDGVNWGRVVAFFEFGAMVCVQCAPDAERSACAENVARWMAEYLNGPLNGWIQENGGWVRHRVTVSQALTSAESILLNESRKPNLLAGSFFLAIRFSPSESLKRTESFHESRLSVPESHVEMRRFRTTSTNNRAED